jgi:hypothetical protein
MVVDVSIVLCNLADELQKKDRLKRLLPKLVSIVCDIARTEFIP